MELLNYKINYIEKPLPPPLEGEIPIPLNGEKEEEGEQTFN
jgi:hypothetical protein